MEALRSPRKRRGLTQTELAKEGRKLPEKEPIQRLFRFLAKALAEGEKS